MVTGSIHGWFRARLAKAKRPGSNPGERTIFSRAKPAALAHARACETPIPFLFSEIPNYDNKNKNKNKNKEAVGCWSIDRHSRSFRRNGRRPPRSQPRINPIRHARDASGKAPSAYVFLLRLINGGGG